MRLTNRWRTTPRTDTGWWLGLRTYTHTDRNGHHWRTIHVGLLIPCLVIALDRKPAEYTEMWNVPSGDN